MEKQPGKNAQLWKTVEIFARVARRQTVGGQIWCQGARQPQLSSLFSPSIRSSTLFIIGSDHQTRRALAVISRFCARINTGGHKPPPQTLEILGFLRWCCSGEFSNRSAIYFCAWVRGWETSKEFDYSIMCLSQKGAGAWAAYARGIATRLNLLSLRGWCHFSPLCHSSLILIPQYVHLLQCFNGYCEMHKHSHWIKPQVTVQCGLRISQLLTHVSITSSVNYS